MGQRWPKFISNISSLRQHTQDLLHLKPAALNHLQDVHVHYVPIEWHEKLHALDTVDPRMRQITLPTVPLMRLMNNDYLGDVIYYFTKYHGQAIVDMVVQSINNAYQEFKESHPDWDGSASLLGHSLGGIIAYDILSHQRFGGIPATIPEKSSIVYPSLNFKPKHLFCVGSPIAAVMIMRGQQAAKYKLPERIAFHNVFHPYDPIAYRFEPLVDPRYSDMDPVMLDHWNENAFQLPTLPSLSLPFSPSSVMAFSEYATRLAGWTSFSRSPAPPAASSESEQEVGHRSEPEASLEPTRKRRRTTSYGDVSQAQTAPMAAQASSKPVKPRPIRTTRPRLRSPGRSQSRSRSRNRAQLADPVTIEQPSSRPSRFSESRWSSVGNDESMQEAEEAALGNLFASATFSSQIPSANLQNTESPGSWSSATLRASQLLRNMTYMFSSTMQRLIGTDEDTGSLECSPRLKPHDAAEMDTDELNLDDATASLPLKRRLDFVLPVNLLETVRHEYLSALSAHFSYWHHRDVAFHILKNCFVDADGTD